MWTHYDDAIRISGAGTVSSSDRDTLPFIIHATQYISEGERSDNVNITICGRMNKNSKWANLSIYFPSQEPSLVSAEYWIDLILTLPQQ